MSVLFHGSMNMEPIPFVPMTLGKATKYGDRDLTAVGFAMYNRWLADFVAAAPHRHVGVAYLPMWDIDEAIKEMTWAREHGLRGINFPSESGPTESSRSRWGGKSKSWTPSISMTSKRPSQPLSSS